MSWSTAAGFGAPRELRVDRLVRHAAVVVFDLHEEVGEPAPATVGEVRLVDDIGLPGPDCLLREPPGLDGVEVPVVVGRKADDRLPLILEPRQVCGLVLVALACDEVRLRVLARRRLRELAAQDGRGELGQVRAGEVGREVRRGEEQRTVVAGSHHLEYRRLGSSAPRCRGPRRELRRKLTQLGPGWRRCCST